MGLVGVTFTPWPRNTQGSCFTAKAKVLGDPRRKKREGLQQEPSTFLRAEAHCRLLQGEGGLDLGSSDKVQDGGPQHCTGALGAPSLPQS